MPNLENYEMISEDVALMFDEMYLQKCEEYFGGEIIGADENNELFKRSLLFMIIVSKETLMVNC